jgi:hypothetical protein
MHACIRRAFRGWAAWLQAEAAKLDTAIAANRKEPADDP